MWHGTAGATPDSLPRAGIAGGCPRVGEHHQVAGSRPRGADPRPLVRDRPGPARGGVVTHLRLDQHRPVRRSGAGGVHVDRPAGRGGAVRRAQWSPAGHRRLRRGPAGTGGPRGRERARGERPLPVHEHRRGPAPLRGPQRRADLPVHAMCRRRCPTGVRLLRAARPQGHLLLGRHRPGRLAGGLQQPDARARGRGTWPCAVGLHPDAATADLPRRPLRRTVPRRALGVHGPARHLSARGLRPGVDGRAPGRRGDPGDHPRRVGPLRA